MLSRLIHGTRLSLLIGGAVVAISVVSGTVLGLLAGFLRGAADITIMRLMDILLTLPSLLLALSEAKEPDGGGAKLGHEGSAGRVSLRVTIASTSTTRVTAASLE